MTTRTSRDWPVCADCAILRNTPRETRSAGSGVSLAVSARVGTHVSTPAALSFRRSSVPSTEDKQSPLPRLAVSHG